ncbi:hypothetical protein ACFX1R_011004 [Malus domestica]
MKSVTCRNKLPFGSKVREQVPKDVAWVQLEHGIGRGSQQGPGGSIEGARGETGLTQGDTETGAANWAARGDQLVGKSDRRKGNVRAAGGRVRTVRTGRQYGNTSCLWQLAVDARKGKSARCLGSVKNQEGRPARRSSHGRESSRSPSFGLLSLNFYFISVLIMCN